MKKIKCDLLVVGAGIYGAWTAYDASLRGLNVLIIDKGDIASGTSSSSSKLIHGGLRYLEQYNFSLVGKAAKERERLMELAPHLVSSLRFGVPIYKDTRVSSWKMKIGLWLYDFLAKIKYKKYQHESLGKREFSNRFNFLKTNNLKQGFTYTDAKTDDARYTLEIIDGAVKSGAKLKTYCSLERYLETNGKITGAILKEGSEEIEVECKAAVNATGRYTDKLLKTKNCRLSKGIHVVLPSIDCDEALLLMSPKDGRVFFLIPWYGKTMVGTTDTDYDGDLNNVEATEYDIKYLLDSINYFMKEPWHRKDVISSFAGLRVLKKEQSYHPSSVKRDWECKVLDNGLFVSSGGKFTSSRHDCSIMVDKVCSALGVEESSMTYDVWFPWVPENYDKFVKAAYSAGERLGIENKIIKSLIKRHGYRTSSIISMMHKDKNLIKPIVDGLPFTCAEFDFVVINEHVKCLEDVIRRRFPISLLKKLSNKEILKLQKRMDEKYEQRRKTYQ